MTSNSSSTIIGLNSYGLLSNQINWKPIADKFNSNNLIFNIEITLKTYFKNHVKLPKSNDFDSQNHFHCYAKSMNKHQRLVMSVVLTNNVTIHMFKRFTRQTCKTSDGRSQTHQIESDSETCDVCIYFVRMRRLLLTSATTDILCSFIQIYAHMK